MFEGLYVAKGKKAQHNQVVNFCALRSMVPPTLDVLRERAGGERGGGGRFTLLLQLRVLRLGLLQDGDVRVGVFPEGEEIVIGAASLGSVTL